MAYALQFELRDNIKAPKPLVNNPTLESIVRPMLRSIPAVRYYQGHPLATYTGNISNIALLWSKHIGEAIMKAASCATNLSQYDNKAYKERGEDFEPRYLHLTSSNECCLIFSHQQIPKNFGWQTRCLQDSQSSQKTFWSQYSPTSSRMISHRLHVHAEVSKSRPRPFYTPTPQAESKFTFSITTHAISNCFSMRLDV